MFHKYHDVMNVEIPDNFYKTWFLHTLYGWFLGFGCLILLSIPGDALGGVQFIMGLSMGIGVGYMQNKALKKIFDVKLKWMWSTIIGLLLPFLAFEFFGGLISPLDHQFDIVNAVLISGVLAGTLQYFILRPFIRKAFLWVIISSLAWGSVGGIILLNEQLSQPFSQTPLAVLSGFFLLIFAPCLVLSSISTFGLKLLLKKINR